MNKPLSKARKMIYCSGSIGFSILDSIIGFYLIYLMMPPKESGLPELLYSKPIFLIFTITGLITIFGRVIDAIADPIIAYWSDNSKFKLGRRRFFLLTGAFPFALFTFLIFITPNLYISNLNAIHVGIFLGLYFFFYTYYMAPYLALLPEISETHDERINLTTFQALFLLIGAGIALLGSLIFWALMQDITHEKVYSFRYAILFVTLIAFISMFIGGFFIKEKYTIKKDEVKIGFLKSISNTIKNKRFLYYMIAIILYWSTFHILRSILKYYPIVLLNEKDGFDMFLLITLFVGAALFFPFIAKLTKIKSNKFVILSGLLSFSIICCITFFINKMGNFKTIAAFIQMGLFGYPIGVLLAIPNAIVADIAEIDASERGINREAIFYGTQGFFMKVVYGLALALVASFLAIFGKDASNPLGVQLTGFAGAAFSLTGFFVMLKYPQKEVTETLAKIRK